MISESESQVELSAQTTNNQTFDERVKALEEMLMKDKTMSWKDREAQIERFKQRNMPQGKQSRAAD